MFSFTGSGCMSCSWDGTSGNKMGILAWSDLASLGGSLSCTTVWSAQEGNSAFTPTMPRCWPDSQMLPVAAILSAIFSLHHIGSWCMVMLDYNGWFPYFGVCPRLETGQCLAMVLFDNPTRPGTGHFFPTTS